VLRSTRLARPTKVPILNLAVNYRSLVVGVMKERAGTIRLRITSFFRRLLRVWFYTLDHGRGVQSVAWKSRQRFPARYCPPKPTCLHSPYWAGTFVGRCLHGEAAYEAGGKLFVRNPPMHVCY
jgi:hypothetical protein